MLSLSALRVTKKASLLELAESLDIPLRGTRRDIAQAIYSKLLLTGGAKPFQKNKVCVYPKPHVQVIEATPVHQEEPTSNIAVPKTDLRLMTWNVNGLLRSFTQHNECAIADLLQAGNIDILCLQDTHLKDTMMSDPILKVEGFKSVWANCNHNYRHRYSGVGIYIRDTLKVVSHYNNFSGYDNCDKDGRFIGVDFGDFEVWSVFVPIGDSEANLNHKVNFCERLLSHAKLLRMKAPDKRIVIAGNFNIDTDQKSVITGVRSVFTDQRSRACMAAILSEGFIDTFGSKGSGSIQCTWPTSQNGNTWTLGNMRIDYILTPPGIECTYSAILQMEGSDHCPVCMDFNIHPEGIVGTRTPRIAYIHTDLKALMEKRPDIIDNPITYTEESLHKIFKGDIYKIAQRRGIIGSGKKHIYNMTDVELRAVIIESQGILLIEYPRSIVARSQVDIAEETLVMWSFNDQVLLLAFAHRNPARVYMALSVYTDLSNCFVYHPIMNWALTEGHLDIVHLLLDKGYSTACHRISDKHVELFKARGAQVADKTGVREVTFKLKSDLSLDIDSFKQCLSKGEYTQFEYCYAVLYTTRMHGYAEYQRVLLENIPEGMIQPLIATYIRSSRMWGPMVPECYTVLSGVVEKYISEKYPRQIARVKPLLLTAFEKAIY